jgi:phosphatidylinositol-3-phosphatase
VATAPSGRRLARTTLEQPRSVVPRLPVPTKAAAVLAAGALLMVGCVAPPVDPPMDTTTTVAVTPPPTPPPIAPSGALCGWGQGPIPAQWDHVVIVIFENKSFAQIFDPTIGAPFLQSLATSCGLATNYWPVWPKSLANYLALTSGDTHGQTIDPPPSTTPIAGDSIFQRLGSDWTVLAETAAQNCQMNNNGTYYEPRHVPSLYYTAIRSTCATRTIPLGAVPDLSRRYTMIIPDKLHDMHMTDVTPDIPGRIKAGDDWFRGFLPKLIDTPQYRAGRTVILVTWDEGQVNNLQVPLYVISPYVAPGARDGRMFTHYSLLRTMQDMLGLTPYLGNAASASSMRGPLAL